MLYFYISWLRMHSTTKGCCAEAVPSSTLKIMGLILYI